MNVAADREIRTVVGLRPFRPAGFVVSSQKVDEKLVVHNYGHGGGGVTLSWGTSELACRELDASGEKSVAVHTRRARAHLRADEVSGALNMRFAKACSPRKHGRHRNLYSTQIPCIPCFRGDALRTRTTFADRCAGSPNRKRTAPAPAKPIVRTRDPRFRSAARSLRCSAGCARSR